MPVSAKFMELEIVLTAVITPWDVWQIVIKSWQESAALREIAKN